MLKLPPPVADILTLKSKRRPKRGVLYVSVLRNMMRSKKNNTADHPLTLSVLVPKNGNINRTVWNIK
jgi:hypothetical protein